MHLKNLANCQDAVAGPFDRSSVIRFVQTCLWIASFFGCSAVVSAVELQSPLDLVTNDVAICVEVPHLEDTWKQIQSGPMAARLRGFAPLLRFLDSPGFRHWQAVEDHVSRQTGARLSAQLKRLFARSLVLAVYVPATGEPRGILIGEAETEDAITTALSTWSKLEPGGVVTTRLHRGQKYLHRKRDPNARESAYIATSGRWFAVSDQESMIHDVIDRFLLLTNATTDAAFEGSLTRLPSFTRNRDRLNRNGAIYVHINARPWDRGLEEAAQDPADPIKLINVWKTISTVSACLRVDQGLVCETEIELEMSNVPADWSKLVQTASDHSTWISRIPGGALLAVAGRLEIAPVVEFITNRMSADDPENFSRIRRICRSLFGGTDVLSSVIPALARNFGGYVTVRRDEVRNQLTVDGVVGFAADVPSLERLDDGLGSLLSLLAVFLSSESRDVVTVERKPHDGVFIRSLSQSARFPIAYGLGSESPAELIVAGSESQLMRAMKPPAETDINRRLVEHSNRFFPGMNQVIWFDTAETRRVLLNHSSELANSIANGSHDEDVRLSRRFEQMLPYLGLVDSLFISGQIASDHVRVVFGGGLDSDSTRSN